MTCPDCTKAQTVWHHGGYRSGCRGCEVRSVAAAPKHIRQQYYAMLEQAQRAAFIEAVRAEVDRVAELRMEEKRV